MAITGCLYAFQNEIQNATQPFRFVEKQNKPFLLPSELQKIATDRFPDKALHAIKYNSKEKSAEAIFYNYEPSYHFIMYLNPYTGETLEVFNMEEGFFSFILDGHFYLWLPHELGQTVVASATLIFVLMLISGCILWYPKNKKVAKQRFWFRWKEGLRWKRKNYDLHNITGFYVMTIALIFAITGLVWGFQWFASGYYTVLGGQKTLLYVDPSSKKESAHLPVDQPLDKVWMMMQKQYPTAKSIEVHPPETAQTSIASNANPDDDLYWRIDYRYYDQYSLKEKKATHIYGRFPEAKVADKLMRMNYDIHTGAILGLTGKIFAFLVSLLIASLPVTGFLIWYGRKKKSA